MRDYDPTTGRYLQADPLGLIDGASVYGYVRQTPLMLTDPSGQCPWCLPALIVAGLVYDYSRTIAMVGQIFFILWPTMPALHEKFGGPFARGSGFTGPCGVAGAAPTTETDLAGAKQVEHRVGQVQEMETEIQATVQAATAHSCPESTGRRMLQIKSHPEAHPVHTTNITYGLEKPKGHL